MLGITPPNKRDPSGKTESTIVGQVTTAQVDAVLERLEIEVALAGIEAQLAAEAISGYSYFLGLLILTAALSQKGDAIGPKSNPDQEDKDDEEIFYRFGFPRESAEQLEEQASKAEGILGIHGVSVRSRPGKYPSPSAPRRKIEKTGPHVARDRLELDALIKALHP